jgi:hypothetical protein
MIKKEDTVQLDALSELQRATIDGLIDRHDSMGYIRRWVTSQESILVNKESTPDLLGKTYFWLTNISSDAIIESVLIFKNGILLKSPYPNYGYPWIAQYLDFDFTIDIKSVEKFIPPMEIHLNLIVPLAETDSITAIVFYRSYIPGDYNFADAIADLYLKRTRDERYLDRDFHLFKSIPQAAPTLKPAEVPSVPAKEIVYPPPVVPRIVETEPTTTS